MNLDFYIMANVKDYLYWGQETEQMNSDPVVRLVRIECILS